MQFEVNWIQTTISLTITITITIIINFISYSSPSSQMPPEIAATATTSAAAPLMLGMPNVCSKEDGQEYYTRKVPCTQARVKMVPIWKSSCTTTTTKTTTHSGINDGVTRTGNHHQRNHHHLSPSEKLFGLRQTNAIPEASASGVASSPRGYQTKSGGCIIYEPRVFQYNSYKIISEKRPRIVYDCCKGWRRENPTDPGCFLPECAENYCLNGGLCLSRNPFSKKTTASGTRGGRSLRKRRGRRKKIGSRKRRHKFYLEVTPSKSMIKHQISDVRTSGSLQHGLDVQITVNHEIPHYFHEHHHHHHHHHHYRPHHPHHHHHRPPDFDYDHKNESKSDKKEGVNALQAESYFVCKCPPGFEGNRCEYQSSKGCTWNKGGCQHICETLVDGSGFICKCRQGFQLNADSKTCSDLNECNSSNGGCQYRCHNTLGSFMCSCPFGYQLSVDRKSCMVQNKCWFNNGGCSQICTMEEDEDEGEDKENEGKVRRPLVRCTCFSGFKLDKDGRNCQDWNECLHNNNSENRLVCSQGCVNTFGSYYCTCYDGFSLGPDGHSCLQTENATSNPWSSGKDEEFSQGETSQVLIKGMNTSSESTYKPETTSTSVREASVQVYANTTSETTSENVDSGGLDGGGGDTSKSLSKSSTETVELTTQTRSVSSNTEDPLLKTLRTSELTNEKTLPPTTKMTRATDEMNETVTVSSFGVGVTREMKRKDDGTPTADPLTTKSTDYGNPPVPTTNTTAKVLGSHGSFPESPAVSKTDPKLETSTQITTFSPSSLPLGGEHGSKLNTDSPFINSVMDDVSTENVSTGRGETVNRAGHESDSNESGQRTSPLAGESDATTPTTSLPSTITKEPSSTQTDGTISLNWETITENGTITGKPTFNLTSSTLPSFSTENPGSSANPVEKSPPTPGKEDEIKLKPITDSPDLNAQNQTVTCNCLNGGTCDQITKKCYCPPGILGDRCESKCPLGFYGIKCDQKCPTSCQTNRCNRHYGFCECDDGFFGPNCNLACDRFTYGPNCRRTCDCEQVNSEQCHVSTGQCICKPGFTGPRCEQRCPPRTWGFNCSRLCECVSNSTCDSVTGVCKNNCPPGLMGNNCDVLCPSGSYGPGCENDCRCPHNAVCDPMTGNCICKSGYWGHLCAEECPPKLYGPNCAFECDCKQNGNCDSETGCCDCPSGYIGPQCENACPEGFFGKRCQDVCSCLNGATKCNHVNGECECPPGFTGTHCEKGCPQGFFGKNCEEECKCTNKWKECRADNGECVCPADASDDECSQEDEKLLPRSRSRGDQPPD